MILTLKAEEEDGWWWWSCWACHQAVLLGHNVIGSSAEAVVQGAAAGGEPTAWSVQKGGDGLLIVSQALQMK